MADIEAQERALVAHLESGDLEAAGGLAFLRARPSVAGVLRRLMEDLRCRAAARQAAGEIRQAGRLRRRHRSLTIFETHGFDLDRLLPAVSLPQRYAGKILLMGICGGIADGRVLLRGGDEWHREILRETCQEVSDCGLLQAQVDALGGGWLRFEGNAAIALWGGSDEFGACDRRMAGKMIRAAFPEWGVRLLD